MNAIVQSVQSLGSVRMVTMGVIGIALLMGFAFLSLRLTSPVLSPLYNNLSAEDSGAVVTELGAMGVNFEVATGGTQIMVESSEVLRVRMALAQKGLPSRGAIVGYEIFDKESALGTSNFVLNVNLLRALEGELGRTIGSLSSVRSARVHLVIPKKELFRKNNIEPSASVIITLNNQTKIAKNETDAIKHLVSSAVPDLKPSKITIVDSSGKLLARGDNESSVGGVDGGISSSNAEEYRISYEGRIKKMVENLLEQTIGPDSVQAQVSAEITFDRVTTSSETFDPEGQVARSVQSNSEKSKSSDGAGGQVGAANNLPSGAAAGAGAEGSGNSAEKVDEVTNFEISKTVSSKISDVGTVKKLSIAVLIDGSYKSEKDEQSDTEKKVYVPRTEDEMEKISTLVKSAVGYNESRGDVVQVINMQFNRSMEQFITEEGAFDWLKRDLDSILKTVMVGIVAILAILLIIRPLVNRAFDVSTADLEAEAAAHTQSAAGHPMPNMPMMPMGASGGGMSDIDIDVIQTKVDTTPTRKVNELIENNPEETLSVVRDWLSQKT